MGKNNGFPTTACFILYIQVMYTINVQRWYTVGQSLENVIWKKMLKMLNLIIAKYVIILINLPNIICETTTIDCVRNDFI